MQLAPSALAAPVAALLLAFVSCSTTDSSPKPESQAPRSKTPVPADTQSSDWVLPGAPNPPDDDVALFDWASQLRVDGLKAIRQRHGPVVLARVQPAIEKLLIRTRSGGSLDEARALAQLGFTAGNCMADSQATRAYQRYLYILQHPGRPVDPVAEAKIVVDPVEIRRRAEADTSERESDAANVVLREAQAAMEQGDLEAAEQKLKPIFEPERSARLTPSTKLRARELLAKLQLSFGHFAEGQRLLEEVLAEWVKTLPDDRSSHRRVRRELAGAHVARGDLAGARAIQEDIVTELDSDSNAGESDRRSALRDLAAILHALDDLVSALAVERRLLAAPVVPSPGDSIDVEQANASLATTLRGLGEFEAAREIEQRILDDAIRAGRGDERWHRGQKRRIAELALASGDYRGARLLFEEVLAGAAAGDFDVEFVQMCLAEAMAGSGDLAGARALLESILASREARLPPGHPDLEATRRQLAQVCTALGDHACAHAQQLAILEGMNSRGLPLDHPDRLDAQRETTATLEHLGELAAADALRDSALAAEVADLPPELRAEAQKAELAQRECRFEDAVTARLRVAEGCRETFTTNDPRTGEALSELAAALRFSGDRVAARKIEREIAAISVWTADPIVRGRPIAAAGRSSASNRYPPEIRIEGFPSVQNRRFEVVATVSCLSGITSVLVRQDGVSMRSRPTLREWTVDPEGTTGQLQLVLEIPPDRSDSLVTISATDHRGVHSRIATVYARP